MQVKAKHLPADVAKVSDTFVGTNLVSQTIDEAAWPGSSGKMGLGVTPTAGSFATNLIAATPGQVFYIQGLVSVPGSGNVASYYTSVGTYINQIPASSVSVTTGGWLVTVPYSATTVAFIGFYFPKANAAAADLVIQTGVLVPKKVKNSLIPDGVWRNNYPNILSKLPNFRKNFTALNGKTADDSRRILLWSDSLFVREGYTTLGPVNPSLYPPGITSNNFSAYLWRNLTTLERPDFARYDVAGVFTETGTWSTVTTNATWDDSTDRPTETRSSPTASAVVSFAVEAAYGRFNFIDRTATNAAQVITIGVTGGNGLLQVQFPGTTTWVEANGATFSQREVDEGALRGNTIYQRHTNFKKIGAAVGASTTVTLTKDATTDFFLYWGIEKIVGVKPYLQLLNLGRGAHTFNQTAGTNLVDYLLDDVIDRKPDLVIVEIPLINMTNATNSMSAIVNSVQDTIWGDRSGALNSNSLKNLSSNWTTFEVLIVLPHVPNAAYNSDGSLIVNGVGYTVADYYTAVKSLFLEKGDLPFVDLYPVFKRYADRNFAGNYYNATVASGNNGITLLSDGTHWNDTGSLVVAKEIGPIFDCNTL
ncbi:hypothetical protein GCM10028808_73080 [Spirosoma migulaei]